MLTFNNNMVWKALKEIAETAFPERVSQIAPFKVNIQAKESKTRHGDYTFATHEIRIFNLSRKSSHIIKTTIHELAHHLDNSFNGSSGHNVRFYTIYKHCLEVAHRMRVINLTDTVDAIDSADLRGLTRSVGELQYQEQEVRDSFIIKVGDAFSIKDALKDHGYTFSSTEKLWILEVEAEQVDAEYEWIAAITLEKNIQMVSRDSNTIDSIYFAIFGKNNLFNRKAELTALGCKYDSSQGWYKRILASEKNQLVITAKQQFGITPSFVGKL